MTNLFTKQTKDRHGYGLKKIIRSCCQRLRKTKRSGIMVAEFIDKHNEYLELTPEKHSSNSSLPKSSRVFLEYSAEREGYWTGDKFMTRVKNALDVVNMKYPSNKNKIVFVYYQSSYHTKNDDQALLAKNILVKDGGPRIIRDTVWAGNVQEMVLPDGRAEGLRTILTERGINHQRVKAEDMRIVLCQHDDFRMRKPPFNNTLRSEGTKCSFCRNFTVN